MAESAHHHPLIEEPAADQPPVTDDYKVGHCQPPLATRFQKGKSGNPRGRPKGSKNTRTILAEKLEEKVKVRLPDGRTRKISKREVGLTKLVNRFAETGELKTLEVILKLEGLETSHSQLASAAVDDEEPISDTGQKMLDWYVSMRASGTEVGDA